MIGVSAALRVIAPERRRSPPRRLAMCTSASFEPTSEWSRSPQRRADAPHADGKFGGILHPCNVTGTLTPHHNCMHAMSRLDAHVIDTRPSVDVRLGRVSANADLGSCHLTHVELRGLEPLTPSLRTRCATSCATAPGEVRVSVRLFVDCAAQVIDVATDLRHR